MTQRPETGEFEYRAILDLVSERSSVLDLGCGDGTLLSLLVREKKVNGQGIEIDEQAIYKCVEKGLSVMHGDIDTGLQEYGDASFDLVILHQSLQQVKKPDFVLKEALRVGNRVIVGFPNFLQIKARFKMFFTGRVPVTPSLPYEWHDTPNLHFLSIFDFVVYCRNRKIKIEKTIFVRSGRRARMLPNLLAETGIFLISR